MSTTLGRMLTHRINGCGELQETGLDAIYSRLEEAHGLLTALEAAARIEGDCDFGSLNSDIQGRALEGVKTLVSLAHFHAHELERKLQQK